MILTLIKNNQEKTIEFNGTPILRDLLTETGNGVFSPCGGKGTCGKCKVNLWGAVSEPNGHEIAAGSRLACQARLLGDVRAELLGEEGFAEIETHIGEKLIGTTEKQKWNYGFALDIGTTTMAMKVFSSKGVLIGEASCLNPQTAVSADVIGRIQYSLEGESEKLRSMVRDALNKLLHNSTNNDKNIINNIDFAIITGNTAMLYFLTDRCPSSIAVAPFESEQLFGEWLDGKTYLPPCMGAFAGADLTCAVLASEMCDSEDTALLCDMGTNGEIALWKGGRLFVTSTAMGPAFEGAEISCGCGGVPGAVSRVWVENGKVKAETIKGQPDVGICGSGLIDAVAVFLELGHIDNNGSIEKPIIIQANGGQLQLLQEDISAVQLAKSAVFSGMQVLLERTGTKFDDIKTFYLAGGFGSHISIENAVKIGLIPKEFSGKTKVMGNGALSGAVKLLFDMDLIKKAESIAENSEHITLGGSEDFNSAFIENLVFQFPQCS